MELYLSNNKTLTKNRFGTILKGLAWTYAKVRDSKYVD